MKKKQSEYKVNLIGEQDLSKLSKDELALLVEYYVEHLKEYMQKRPDGSQEKMTDKQKNACHL